MKTSWKTTVCGALALIAALATGGLAILNGESIDIEVIAGALAGVGLLVARDNSVTSESAGAKR